MSNYNLSIPHFRIPLPPCPQFRFSSFLSIPHFRILWVKPHVSFNELVFQFLILGYFTFPFFILWERSFQFLILGYLIHSWLYTYLVTTFQFLILGYKFTADEGDSAKILSIPHFRIPSSVTPLIG